MGIGITESLAFAAFCVWVVGVVILYRQIGLLAATAVVTIKVGITLVYFSYLYNGELLMKDDQVYFDYGIALYDMGWGPLRILIEPGGLKEIALFVGSGHILYYWWNILAFSLFGKFYYSPVFLNVGLTFFCALILKRLVVRCGFSERFQRAFLIFFLLHWDIITWSSFVNLKDMIVLLLTIASMLLLLRMYEHFRFRQLLLLAFVFWLFSMIRYYLPVLVMAGGGLWLMFEWKDRRKYLLIPVIGAGVSLFLVWGAKDFFYIKFQPSPYLALRFFLMPQFWTLQQDESFLFISSFLHWLLFMPLLFGAYALWWKGPAGRLLIVYAFLIIAFYSVVPELQGYRHRQQISFIIALCQFVALWGIFQIEPARRKLPYEATFYPEWEQRAVRPGAV